MHIWDDKPSSVMHQKVFSKKMDYSNCPLKKRPVNFVKFLKEEMEYDNTDDYAEPENLSTKPQDLSVKCKTEITAVSASSFDSKKDLPSSYTTPYNNNNNNNYQHTSVVSSTSPYHSNHQQPYQPTPVKPGPLEPLCLNISGDHHPGIIPSATSAAAAAYHHHRRQYAPATPRPVPAQYPGTGYLAGYIYHHGGLTAERGYPVVTPGSVYHPQTVIAGTTARDMSLSPPGSGGSGSAFKPLHAISSPTVITSATCSPPSMPWYARGGSWSAADMDVSPPLPVSLSSNSSSPSAISPSYGAPSAASPAYGPPSAISPPLYGPPSAVSPSSYGPPPAVPYTHCSGESDASSAAADYKRKSQAAARYKCPSCTKTYSTVAGLTKHQQYHGSDDECAAAAAAAKTFCCKFCDKAYNTLGALKMHIRTHTLPCICNLCGKAFSRPWLLQGHIRTHTGEKPFSCQHCNRAFADRSNLRAHLQTHSDVKKYSCPTCSKTFSRMSLLTKHCDTGCQRLQQQQQPQPLQQQPQLLQQQPQLLQQQPQMLHQQPQMLQ